MCWVGFGGKRRAFVSVCTAPWDQVCDAHHGLMEAFPSKGLESLKLSHLGGVLLKL